MADIRDRFVAYGTRPDVYDAPTPLECVTIASEVKRLREALKECEADIDGYIRQEYPADHPVHERYRARDFGANPARIALANHRDA